MGSGAHDLRRGSHVIQSFLQPREGLAGAIHRVHSPADPGQPRCEGAVTDPELKDHIGGPRAYPASDERRRSRPRLQVFS